MGHSSAGLFGFSHMMGGYAGRQAEYLSVPFADVAPIKIPGEILDEKVLFLSDIFPTGKEDGCIKVVLGHSGFQHGEDSPQASQHDALAVRRCSFGHRRHARRQ